MTDVDRTKLKISAVGKVLQDQEKPLSDRFRSLFTLKNLGGQEAIDSIAGCFDDPSCLLKHECAYCLGQMQDLHAIPVLSKVLEDRSQESMVRHEAGEALGAIGSKESLELLEKYTTDPIVEVAETCQLAVERIKWLHRDNREDNLSANPYSSVDPAPPSVEQDIQQLRATLLNESLPLFERYKAMFALRNMGTTEAVHVLGAGLKCNSALFKHEVAYVLGQMQNAAGVDSLRDSLQDKSENAMVRHECAEALGSIASQHCVRILHTHLQDQERVVKESCEVALDMYNHETSGQFQYANTLNKMSLQQNGTE